MRLCECQQAQDMGLAAVFRPLFVTYRGGVYYFRIMFCAYCNQALNSGDYDWQDCESLRRSQ